MGERVWTVMWEPLFRSKFGAFADEISMTWLYGRLRARFGPAQPGVPKGRLGYLRGSVQVLVDALADRLRASGADLRVSTPVRRIAVEDGRAVGVETREGLERHDRVLCSAATPQFLKMTEGSLPPELERALARFRYLGSVVAVLEMSRPSGPAYWVNILDPGIPILAVVEQTRMIGPEHYGGRHVLYVSRYVDREDPCFRAKDAEILEGWYPHLEKVLPDFDRSGILRARVMRADYTQPIVDRGYGRRIPAHRMPVRDLYLANMTQIYPEDRGMNYSIRLGRKVARMIHEDSRG
jgi:protoporphyrinogen oxidase